MIVKAKIKLFVAVLSIILYSASSEIPVPTIYVDSGPDALQVSWTPVAAPTDVDCHVAYGLSHTVNGVDQPRIVTNVTSVTLPPSSPCQENVFVLVARCRHGIDLVQANKTYTTSTKDAGRIQNLQVNNNRVEWAARGYNGYCTVSYEIEIFDNIERHLSSSNVSYVEFNFASCRAYHIRIKSIVEDTLVTLLAANFERGATDIGKVEDITFTESDGQMLVTWPPAIIGFCDIVYVVRHSINGIHDGLVFTTDTSAIFTSNYCAEHSIVIQVMANMILGEKNTARAIASSRGPDPVTNLQITKYSDKLFVTWDPSEVGFCPIKYLVEHTINGVRDISIDVTETSVFLTRTSCSDNNIIVTAVADTSIGLPKNQFIHVSLESLEAVKNIAVYKDAGELSVSWSPIVKGQCDVFYRITNYDGATTSTYETNETSYIIGKTNCANNTVTVVGIERTTELISAPSYYVIDVDIDLSSVQNLHVSRTIDGHLQIDWERPVGSENCLVNYLVNVRVPGNKGFFKQTDATSINANISIDGCKVFEVAVTPISPAGRIGVGKSVNNTAYLFEVPSVNRLSKYAGVLTWERPYNVGICDLLFRVVVENEKGLIVNEIETNKMEINLDMVPCRNYISSVKAVDVLTNLTSDWKVEEETGKPRFIDDVRELNHHLNRENLLLSWNPVQAGDCGVSYNVKHTLDGDYSNHITNQSQLVVSTISCSVNELEITPSLREGVTGIPFEYSIDVGLDVLEEITDLSVSSSLSNRVEWIRPAFAGNCAISYLVHIIESNCLVHNVTTNDEFVNFNFIPCREYRVLVTPQHKERVGTRTELRFIAAALAHAPPSHVRTVPSLASANVTLEVNSATVNSCPVEAIRVTCRESTGSEIVVDSTIVVQDNPERKFELGLTDLTHNTHFICNAQVLLPHQSEFGQAFEFLTTEILPLRSDVSDVTSTNITVSWGVQQGLERYVVDHVLLVTIVGPNHFVQESCNIPRGTTERIEVPASALSYTITNALPNFKYHISFGTRFNIGIDKFADSVTVNTLPSVPGPIVDLNPKFILEDCAQWSGTGFFTWTPPCDINGDLESFEVTVGTNYTIGSENREYTENTILQSSDADGDYVFSVRIPTLNPFFIYNVSIKIFAAYPGQYANVLKEVQAPGAYTACIADH